MKKIILPAIALLALFACKKEKPVKSGLSAYYHINGNDTLSVLYIPNSFTPEGDGVNDVFIPRAAGCEGGSYLLEILNNSEVVFRSHQLESYWDGTSKGTNSPNGKYQYRIALTDTTSYTYHISGEVYLIR